MSEQVFTLLGKFYPPEGMFLKRITDCAPAAGTMEGEFVVPTDAIYTSIPIKYVAAEQYVRCLAQLSYGLMYVVCTQTEDGASHFGRGEDFEHRIYAGKLWYRRLTIRHFTRRVTKGDPFLLTATLEKLLWEDHNTVAQIQFDGPVHGCCEFVAPV